jgi:hypothetical protein
MRNHAERARVTSERFVGTRAIAFSHRPVEVVLTMVQGSPISWAVRWWKSISETLGDIWSQDAQKAYQNKELRSKNLIHAGLSMRLAFRNMSPVPLIICWISEHGEPHKFYKLEPFSTVPEDVSMVTADDRTEHTSLGHAFTFSAHSSETDIEKKHLDPTTIIGGYRPMQRSLSGKGSDSSVHIVTIAQKKSGSIGSEYSCSRPWGVGRLRKRSLVEMQNEEMEFVLSVQEGSFDPTPLDTSKKHYDEAILGGWPVRLEPNWHGGDKTLEERLEKDLQYVTEHLPKHARDELRKNTPIYINRSQQYGPKACPVSGRGMCFHPGADWLKEMGMSTDKAECVEMYEAAEELKDRDEKLWGLGGVILHELSHAYHWKMMRDRYDNNEIIECWEKAMCEKLYDCVRVHGSKGTAKAYACTDQMEYFAELSAAFLGGLDPDEEYNKWFPFNRSQLKEHDPRAYKLLQKVWRVNCDDSP